MMRTVKLSAIITVYSCVLLATGCNQELQDLRIQNNTQRELIASLESKLQVAELELDKLNRQLEALHGKGGIEVETLEQKIAALEEDIAKKNELIASMQQRLLSGGAALPVELSTLLEDFAKEHEEMVTYDSSSGVVKFKSDLLFERASDTVSSHAIEAVKTLCSILNSEEGKKFDIIIAGHTDDIPIARPATRDKHPTNWHLSSHRAISVLQVMENSNIDPTRLSTRGFGEYRPVVPNGPNKTGNQQNRRVEIYIVAQGT
jgi:chemotaxis protein MotB